MKTPRLIKALVWVGAAVTIFGFPGTLQKYPRDLMQKIVNSLRESRAR
ncbi:MAG: hypothetical protein NT009_11000 [Proteobacteria bacterium]|nr:hypothetical protein [Pseudomonadota bacterium]